MSRNYKFHNSEGLYFISFAVVGWLDVFIRNGYKEILRFCQKCKRMEIYSWYITSSHVHLVFHEEDCRYSNAIDCADEKGLLGDIVVFFRMFD